MAVPLIAAFSGCGADDGRSLLSKLKAAIGSETEPNATTSMATPIGSQARLRGHLYPAGDTDLYSFTGAAGDRVFIATMTSASPGATDTQIDLLDRDGTTGLETDDENGVFGTSASSIAGATLPGAGTYFIRVTGGAGPSNVRPYDLYFRRQSVASVPEVEPNDTTATAQAFPASGFVDGTVGSTTDQDHYSISLNAGDTVFLSLDLWPTRTGTPTSGRLGLGRFANSVLLVNDSGTSDNTPSQALFMTVQTAGTYFISVDIGGGTATGGYRLSATVFPRDPVGARCTTYTSTDVPKTIPAGPGQVTSIINVPGNPVVAELSVALGMTHVQPQDVDVELTAPGGNTAVLFTDVGSATFPDIDVTLNQAAGIPIGSFPVISGQVLQPESAYRLHWFDGQPAGGAWTLTVIDDSGANGGGTLNNWALEVCERAPATCPSGDPPATVASFDFEAGASGFTHSGTADVWALGTPTAAPITNCNGGTQCWKTNLAGSYPSSSFQGLASPTIDLTAATPPIFVSWAMKYQMESAPFDRAWVEIQHSDGTNPRRLWEWRDGDMAETVGTATQVQEAAGWGTTTADVSEYAGGVVRLVFHLDSDLTGQLAGLAIDDVSVKHCPSVCGNGVVEPGEECDLGATANGASDACCTLSCGFRPGAASYICRAAISACDASEFCTGSSGVCPADGPEPDGTACNDGNACTQPDTCQSGACTAGAALSCDDHDACTTDTCNPAAGCEHSGTCAPDGGGGTDGGGGGGNGSCGCTSLGGGGGAELVALQLIGMLVMAMRRRARR